MDMRLGEPAEGSDRPRSGLLHLTEADLAELRLDEGARVVEVAGRFWAETFPGFFQPIHQLAEHRADRVVRPTWRCWGYRSVLVAEDRRRANGAYPVHLDPDFRNWTVARFADHRRRDLRRCQRLVRIAVTSDPEPFLADGWSAYAETQRRIGLRAVSRQRYLAEIARRVPDPRRLFVAGFVGGRLAGYLESYIVDGVLYGRDLFVRDDAVATGIATGLYHRTFEIGAASGLADRLCLGPEHSERPGLAFFKASMGVGVVRLPIRVVIPGPVRAAMRALRPAAYHRITGGAPDRPPAGPADARP